MDEIIIANTRERRGEHKKRERRTRRIGIAKRKKSIRYFAAVHPRRQPPQSLSPGYFFPLLTLSNIFFLLSKRSSSVPRAITKIIITLRFDENKNKRRIGVERSHNSAQQCPSPRTIILMFRGWFILRSPPSCARYLYYYLPLYERTRFIGPFTRMHLYL